MLLTQMTNGAVTLGDQVIHLTYKKLLSVTGVNLKYEDYFTLIQFLPKTNTVITIIKIITKIIISLRIRKNVQSPYRFELF